MLARGASIDTIRKATRNDTVDLSLVAQTLQLSCNTNTYELYLMLLGWRSVLELLSVVTDGLEMPANLSLKSRKPLSNSHLAPTPRQYIVVMAFRELNTICQRAFMEKPSQNLIWVGISRENTYRLGQKVY